MKALLTTFAAVFTLVSFSSCGGKPSHEEVASDMMDAMGDYADTLAGVKDEASAEKASKALEKIAEKLKKLKEQADSLGEPSAAVKAQIEQQLAGKQAELQQKMMGMMGALMTDPKLMDKLGPALEKFHGIMEK